jgi:hypothetical protein
MCQSGKKIIFCSCKNDLKKVVHHKKSKRWQEKNATFGAYLWTLSRFVDYFESMMEGQISEPSEKLGQDLTSEFVLSELNSRNCFDFEYLPIEGDCLSIRMDTGWNFFSFIFREGTWIAEQYSSFYVRTERLDAGKLQIKTDNEAENAE